MTRITCSVLKDGFMTVAVFLMVLELEWIRIGCWKMDSVYFVVYFLMCLKG